MKVCAIVALKAEHRLNNLLEVANAKPFQRFRRATTQPSTQTKVSNINTAPGSNYSKALAQRSQCHARAIALITLSSKASLDT